MDGHEIDLSQCDREPIHVPGSIQPTGLLFAVDPNSLVIFHSAIPPRFKSLFAYRPLVRLPDLLPGTFLATLRSDDVNRVGSTHLGMLDYVDHRLSVSAHWSGDLVILELEPCPEGPYLSFDNFYPSLRDILSGLHDAPTIASIGAIVAKEVRHLTGFDRVLVYQFDADWHGTVIAEDRNDVLPSYLDLRFPASDIPAQARELYRKSRIRLIQDADYEPTPIEPSTNPITRRPLDLSFAALRSVSPVHLTYMRNMGTAASMSISLLDGDKLWGLISCHNRDSKEVSPNVRTVCDFIGQIASTQIASRLQAADARERDSARSFQTRLLASMSGAEHFSDALAANADLLLRLTNAQGAAIIADEQCVRIGATPSEEDILNIARDLSKRNSDVYETDQLSKENSDFERLAETAAGVLAISISQIHSSYIIWFRPEVVRTVAWGGNPEKPAVSGETRSQLSPRVSFERWQEIVHLRAAPWKRADVEAAQELRSAIVDIVLRNAEELAALSERLGSINRELEAFSYSVSHDLRAPFRHIVGYSQLLLKNEIETLTERGQRYVETIIESAISAGKLVDDLLSFSQMGRSSLKLIRVDMAAVIEDVRKTLAPSLVNRHIQWQVGALHAINADGSMIKLAVQNLLENAIKFTRNRETAIIDVSSEKIADSLIFHFKDNGVGFDMAYVGKLFGVFQRLHRVEEFEGTGIGLANVKRIIERHGGKVWAESTLNVGTTISFSIPAGAQEHG